MTNFLVIDIDKDNWQAITTAIIEINKKYDLSTALERSQSGDGGHLWYFFKNKVPAKLARQLGKQLIKSAMSINPDISFEAFDRLFPNQDELPEGGLGNLIAAPLQYDRIKDGNSLFIDENFKPYENQWTFLRDLKAIDEIELHKVVKKIDAG